MMGEPQKGNLSGRIRTRVDDRSTFVGTSSDDKLSARVKLLAQRCIGLLRPIVGVRAVGGVVLNSKRDSIGDEQDGLTITISDPDPERIAAFASRRQRFLEHIEEPVVGSDIDGIRAGSVGESSYEDSLTSYGAHCACAPTASTEAATSVVGDIVRDGSDISPGSLTPVEESPATGAAAQSERPHPNLSTESGSDQR